MDAEVNAVIKQIIPPLTFDSHKGQGGRVGVLGGCRDYTGAPFYAAMSALRTGAELSHVFCSEGAACAIKAYSPELIVHAVVPDTVPADDDTAVAAAAAAAVERWFPALDALVIGPGLGRDAHMLALAARVARAAVAAHLPLVLDGDGLWMVAHDLAVVRGARAVVLTPNLAEYSRLAAAVAGRDPAAARATDAVPPATALAAALAGPTVLQKGARTAGGADVVAGPDNTPALCCTVPGAPRRCGGQGDVLAGATAAFFAWLARHNRTASAELSPAFAAVAAAALTRTAAHLAFATMRRAMLTTDIIQCLGDAFESLYGGGDDNDDDDDI